jgi:hypothetical protein
MLRPDRPNHGACLRADFIADMPSRVDRADWQWQHRSRNRNRPMMSRGNILEPAVRLLKAMRIQLKEKWSCAVDSFPRAGRFDPNASVASGQP